MAKKSSNEVFDFIKETVNNKKFQWTITIILFLLILISSTQIRLSNLPNLIDETTGLYTSNDLDSLYFYRVAETKLNNGGVLPEFDELRSPGRNIGWIEELLPDMLIWNYKVLRVFNSDITFDYAAAISAPIFYAIGLVLFFIMCLLLTQSKVASLIASGFLAYAPGFLFRSIAGFYDHDHVGVFALFALVIASFYAMKKFEKNYKNSVLFGIIVGFFTALVLVSWGGAITFVLVFLPVALLFYYLFNNQNKLKFLFFYLVWVISSVLSTPLLGSRASFMYNRFLDSQGLLVLFVLGFAIIDFIFELILKKKKFIEEKYEKLAVVLTTLVLGIIGLFVVGKNPLTLVKKAWATLIYPFFGDFASRLETTVAENAQPYLTDLIGQNGTAIFWLFIIGIIMLCINLTRSFDSVKNKIILSGTSILLLFAVLFSRVSSGHILNGENIISQLLYLIGGICFVCGVGYVYYKERKEIDITSILLLSVAITVVLNARAAIRSFFLITPFICLIAGYGIIELIRILRKSKDETIKYLYWVIFAIIGVVVYVIILGNPFDNTVPGSYQISSSQAERVGPSANAQWQNAMEWARENTDEKDIFVHWWDYGYFVQTLGERPTVTDGGHSGGGVSGDHFIGRYVLTTPNPKTAFSFMKTWNVSYLLIDPTEMGKYGAFSKIGSNDSWDRISSGIFGGASDTSQTQETATEIVKVYQLGGCVDEDIAYINGSSRVFIPGISISKTQQMQCNSYAIGAIVEFDSGENGIDAIKQPIGVFLYNNRQYRIPIKNVYVNGQMISFNDGIDSVLYLIPSVDTTTGKIDELGATIYLSPRTFNSLMGKLYILNDPFDEYPTLTKAHFEEDPAIAYFKQFTGGVMNEFIWYQGIRAPLKIWEANYPEGTPTYREFLNLQEDVDSGIYYTMGEMDKYF